MKPALGFQYAGAYLFSSRMVIVSHESTRAGLLVQCEPFIDVPLDADDEPAGNALLKSLQCFRINRPAPDSFAVNRKKQLKALGFSSDRKLQQRSLYCTCKRSAEGFRFEPTFNGGTTGEAKGYQSNGTAFVLPLGSSASELGAALRRCFSLSTTTTQPTHEGADH